MILVPNFKQGVRWLVHRGIGKQSASNAPTLRQLELWHTINQNKLFLGQDVYGDANYNFATLSIIIIIIIMIIISY